jgi:predicted DNA-binding transcriptional regulator AlpA
MANPLDALLIHDTEAAHMAGVSRAHWHRLRASGKVPAAVRLGRSVRWRRAEIEQWILAGCPDARTWAAMQASAGRRLSASCSNHAGRLDAVSSQPRP